MLQRNMGVTSPDAQSGTHLPDLEPNSRNRSISRLLVPGLDLSVIFQPFAIASSRNIQSIKKKSQVSDDARMHAHGFITFYNIH